VAVRPYVLLSAAMSADGYLDDATSNRLILSGPEDLDRVDELRAGSSAILVGAQTIRSDNPRLLVRSAGRRRLRRERGLTGSPVRVTLTGSGELDPAARFFAAADEPPLVYAGRAAAAGLTARLGGRAVVVAAEQVAAQGATAEQGADGLDLSWILADLAARGVGRLMVEGGSAVLAGFLSAGLADELILAVAPLFVADPAAPRLLSGAPPPPRMRLAQAGRAGDMAVLTYRPLA
jgi:5-amino-6-(5-phosphoribosylamino)uracil reductase